MRHSNQEKGYERSSPPKGELLAFGTPYRMIRIRRMLTAQGGRSPASLAVTGETGDFSNVRGEALQVFTGTGFDFTMEFDLKAAEN